MDRHFFQAPNSPKPCTTQHRTTHSHGPSGTNPVGFEPPGIHLDTLRLQKSTSSFALEISPYSALAASADNDKPRLGPVPVPAAGSRPKPAAQQNCWEVPARCVTATKFHKNRLGRLPTSCLPVLNSLLSCRPLGGLDPETNYLLLATHSRVTRPEPRPPPKK